jgi:hypothetical protein
VEIEKHGYPGRGKAIGMEIIISASFSLSLHTWSMVSITHGFSPG